jgi:hypothetical protein
MSDATPRMRVFTNGDAEARARAEYLAAGGDPAHVGRAGECLTGYDIILHHFRAYYQPTFRRGENIYSSALGREVTRGAACTAPGIELVNELAKAADAPRVEDGVVRSKLPQFFKTWAPSAWVDLLRALPDEERADEVTGSAGDEFAVRVGDALNSFVTIAHRYRNNSKREDRADRARPSEPEAERRTVLDWCCRFAKPGPWQSIRGYKVWIKQDEHGGVCVAIRVELFPQLYRRDFAGMTPYKFAQLAEHYGVGRSGRVCGKRVVILAEKFLDEHMDVQGKHPGTVDDSLDDEVLPRARAPEQNREESTAQGESDEATKS